MHHAPSRIVKSAKLLTLSQAFEGYFVYAQARRLSPNTLDNYVYVFRKLATYLPDDPP
jgi:hypothetical protein